MKLEQLYLTMVMPFLGEFKSCNIYNFELKKFNQELAESLNQKNIYNALDIPDFKNVRESKLKPFIIKHACKKLKIGREIELSKTDSFKTLNIDGVKYQLIFFPSGTVPEIELKHDKLIFLMYFPEFKKIYYCGVITNINHDEKSSQNFYKEKCLLGTKKFIDFKNLKR